MLGFSQRTAKLRQKLQTAKLCNVFFVFIQPFPYFCTENHPIHLTNSANTMNVGDKLPEFLGTNEKGEEITLTQYKGRKLIVYAYPKDNTSGCTAEACSLKQHFSELSQAGYAVIGVSKDSAASHQKFIDKHELPFPLIADTEKQLLQALGAWGEKSMYGRKTLGTLRTTYLVNEEGVIEKIFTPKEIKTKTHAEQILDYINH